jgi:predicted enzyme related to lactoylglutathione lyase
MGTYQMFATGDSPVGGIMTKPAAIPMPYWGYYFNVDGIDAAAERVTAGGGAIINGPHQVPGGQWIVQCTDPQGAAFALVATRR